MTCIVGLVDKGKVYMGGDSAGVAGSRLTIRKDPKVWKNSNTICGMTSSFRLGNLLRYSFTPPYHDPRKDDYNYMCTTFITEVIKVLKDNGYARIESNEVIGGTFLVGYNKNLYYIDSDFQVGMNKDNFAACGCGEAYALATLKTLEKSNISPKEKIKMALENAAYFSAGVCGPFNYVEL